MNILVKRVDRVRIWVIRVPGVIGLSIVLVWVDSTDQERYFLTHFKIIKILFQINNNKASKITIFTGFYMCL